jgi:CheY-like chemotaxis protein
MADPSRRSARASGAEARGLANEFAPEIALLDVGMPGMDGNELARHLRQVPAMAQATLVALLAQTGRAAA